MVYRHKTSFHCIVCNGSVWCPPVNWIMRQIVGRACGSLSPDSHGNLITDLQELLLPSLL